MSLLDARNKLMRNNPSLKEVLDKINKVKTSTNKRSSGGSLISQINTICEQVQSRLGKYADSFELITTKERLHEYIDKAIEQNIISIDTETTGLDPICDQIVGACIYTYNEKAAYIPINHISYFTNERLNGQLTSQEVTEEFQRIVDKQVKVIMFNAKFDIRVIRHQLGVYMTPAWCGFVAGKCLKENEPEANLKYLWKKYCSPDKEAEHFTFDKMFEGLKFNLIPIKTAYLYAAKDALMTMELYDFQKRYLDPEDEYCQKAELTRVASLYNNIELPIINIIADIEDAGVALDLERVEQLKVKYHALLDKQLEAFHNALKEYQPQIDSYLQIHPDSTIETPLNVGSSTQLAELFYDVLKLPSVSKKKPRGTGEDILKELNHPLSKLILDYRGSAKMISTYIDKMPDIRNKKTGRIHCNYNQMGADTGRLSSSDPNMQNIPSANGEIRQIFMSTRTEIIFSTEINNENILTLLKYDGVITESGTVFAQDLLSGMKIITQDQQQKFVFITKITMTGNDICVYISNEAKIQVNRLYILIGSDYSQQEPKLTAHMCKDAKFISDCAAGRDAYATIASIAFKYPYEECLEFYLDENGNKTNQVNKEGKKRRSTAKVILLGICYGKQIKTLAEDMHMTEQQAEEVYNGVLNNIPGLKHFMDESQNMARVHGWVETNWGRRRHIPEMQLEPFEIISKGVKTFDPFFDSEQLGVVNEIDQIKANYKKELIEAKYYSQRMKIKEKAEKEGFKIVDNVKKIDDATRQCVNSRIQGSAADQTKIAMRLIGTNEDLKRLKFRMLLLVHDEIIGECPLINAREAGPIFLQCMLDAAKDLTTGAKVDPTCSLCWYGEDYKLEELTEEKLVELINKVYR